MFPELDQVFENGIDWTSTLILVLIAISGSRALGSLGRCVFSRPARTVSPVGNQLLQVFSNPERIDAVRKNTFVIGDLLVKLGWTGVTVSRVNGAPLALKLTRADRKALKVAVKTVRSEARIATAQRVLKSTLLEINRPIAA